MGKIRKVFSNTYYLLKTMKYNDHHYFGALILVFINHIVMYTQISVEHVQQRSTNMLMFYVYYEIMKIVKLYFCISRLHEYHKN